MEKRLFLILNIGFDLTEGELGAIPESFFYAEDAEKAYQHWKAWASKGGNPEDFEDDYLFPDMRILEINPATHIITIWIHNDNMGDWEEDTTECITNIITTNEPS